MFSARSVCPVSTVRQASIEEIGREVTGVEYRDDHDRPEAVEDREREQEHLEAGRALGCRG